MINERLMKMNAKIESA
jgi:hypothetical protein